MTRMAPDQVAEHEARIQKEYDAYVEAKRERRRELMAKVDEQAEADTHEQLVEISKLVRGAYGMGVPKGALRRATRAYTNTEYWNKVWDAAAEKVPVDDRAQRTVATVNEPYEIITDDPKDQGAKFIEAGKKATLVIRSGPDGIPWAEPVKIALERKALRGPWIMDPDEPWYDPEGEILVGNGELLEWGDGAVRKAIDKVIEMYAPRKGK